ncbi:MAG: M90 family metallopeptidase [bacterium]
MPLLKRWSRKRIRNRAFPAEWLPVLEKNAPFYSLLPEGDREELRRHILVFLAEKHFEGCGGLEIRDEIRLTVAAHACLLLLHRQTDYFPKVQSLVVYPSTYVAPRVERDPDGLVHEGEEVREGESWDRGTVVLSWEDVRKSSMRAGSGRNVVLHEFAHQLDQESGEADGAPLLPRPMYAEWSRVLGREFRRLERDVQRNRRTFIDPYGATDPAEFFAVTTECFFERPVELRQRHPELYEQLSRYYQQDPAELAQSAIPEESGDSSDGI